VSSSRDEDQQLSRLAAALVTNGVIAESFGRGGTALEVIDLADLRKRGIDPEVKAEASGFLWLTWTTKGSQPALRASAAAPAFGSICWRSSSTAAAAERLPSARIATKPAEITGSAFLPCFTHQSSGPAFDQVAVPA
jgi:hypothetical protein